MPGTDFYLAEDTCVLLIVTQIKLQISLLVNRLAAPGAAGTSGLFKPGPKQRKQVQSQKSKISLFFNLFLL